MKESGIALFVLFAALGAILVRTCITRPDPIPSEQAIREMKQCIDAGFEPDLVRDVFTGDPIRVDCLPPVRRER